MRPALPFLLAPALLLGAAARSSSSSSDDSNSSYDSNQPSMHKTTRTTSVCVECFSFDNVVPTQPVTGCSGTTTQPKTCEEMKAESCNKKGSLRGHSSQSGVKYYPNVHN